MPTVSVIIPTFNHGRFVGEAVQSALDQTLPPREVIVVDDGSIDETAHVLGQFGDRIRVVRQENLGVAAARNTGAAHAGGDLLAFLDADDVWLPHKLEKQVQRFAQEPELGLVHCGLLEVDAARRPLRRLLDGMEGWVATELLLFRRRVILGGGSGMVVSRQAYDTVEGFDSRLPPTEDWDFWYRLSRRFRVGFVPEVLLHYRCHGGNDSLNLMKRERGLLLIYEKAFQNPDPALQRLRRRAYGNLHLGLAGFYLSAGQPRASVRHMLRSLWLTPRNLLRLFTHPFRHVRRLARERPACG